QFQRRAAEGAPRPFGQLSCCRRTIPKPREAHKDRLSKLYARNIRADLGSVHSLLSLAIFLLDDAQSLRTLLPLRRGQSAIPGAEILAAAHAAMLMPDLPPEPVAAHV